MKGDKEDEESNTRVKEDSTCLYIEQSRDIYGKRLENQLFDPNFLTFYAH